MSLLISTIISLLLMAGSVWVVVDGIRRKMTRIASFIAVLLVVAGAAINIAAIIALGVGG